MGIVPGRARGHAERLLAQGVGQHPQLHDDITEGVAQSTAQLVGQLEGADITLLPHIEPHTNIGPWGERESERR